MSIDTERVKADPVSRELHRQGIEGELLHRVLELEYLYSGAEKLATAKTIAVAANNKFPHWSLERWALLANLIIMIVGGIWFAATQWGDVKRGLDKVSVNIEDVKRSAAEDRQRNEEIFQSIRKQIEDIKKQPRK